jgi:hypothetical protein
MTLDLDLSVGEKGWDGYIDIRDTKDTWLCHESFNQHSFTGSRHFRIARDRE